jgi:hypothetical protein
VFRSAYKVVDHSILLIDFGKDYGNIKCLFKAEYWMPTHTLGCKKNNGISHIIQICAQNEYRWKL